MDDTGTVGRDHGRGDGKVTYEKGQKRSAVVFVVLCRRCVAEPRLVWRQKIDAHESEDGEADVDPEVGEEPSLDEDRKRRKQTETKEQARCAESARAGGPKGNQSGPE